MHYHLEIVMPPTADVKAAVAQVMAGFREGGGDEGGNENRHAFWDWYVIGGRWAGVKLTCAEDQARLDQFNEELVRRKVTVSSFVAGRTRLDPASQAPAVDALWREFFPGSPLKACPLFDHFNDQYNDSDGFPDVMRLGDVPPGLAALHVIVAGPSRDGAAVEARYMAEREAWNGVNFARTAWDGKVASAVDAYRRSLEGCAPERAEKLAPEGDWLVVTVDYHA